MTRRVTLVNVLRGGNGYSLAELNAMNAVKGVGAFLTRAASLDISNTALADALVAFKAGGGVGLANAISDITAQWDAPTDPCAPENAAIEQAKQALLSAYNALDAVS